MFSTISDSPGFMSPQKLNPVEPPWYGPVCPVVWEGRRCEASPYPDLRGLSDAGRAGETRAHSCGRHLKPITIAAKGWISGRSRLTPISRHTAT